MGGLISLTGLTQGDQRWIETHITHTSSHDTGDQWRCLSNSHALLSVYILHTPAAAVQLNLLTGKETTKASLTEYMLNTLAPGFVSACVCVCE